MPDIEAPGRDHEERRDVPKNTAAASMIIAARCRLRRNELILQDVVDEGEARSRLEVVEAGQRRRLRLRCWLLHCLLLSAE